MGQLEFAGLVRQFPTIPTKAPFSDNTKRLVAEKEYLLMCVYINIIYMNSLKDIRTQLGLSQCEMANKLGIERSRLAKAETGDRSLDSASLMKLAELEKGVREHCPVDTNADRAISYCRKQLRNNNQAIINLERKLERMQRCYVIGKELPIATLGCKHQKRVERRHINCGSCAQQIVKIKMDMLLGANRLLEQFIADLSHECP